MSWRETLGVTPLDGTSYTHNSHNTQKPADTGNCADITDCAYGKPELTSPAPGQPDKDIPGDETLGDIRGVSAPELSAEEAEVLALLTEMRNQMNNGIRPARYNKAAYCKGCGPVWLWFSGDVLGCPWCWNRAAKRPIPRPYAVQCSDCLHFARINHPHLGHCSQGQPENIAGLWDDDHRLCHQFSPLPNDNGEHDEQEQSVNDQP